MVQTARSKQGQAATMQTNESEACDESSVEGTEGAIDAELSESAIGQAQDIAVQSSAEAAIRLKDGWSSARTCHRENLQAKSKSHLSCHLLRLSVTWVNVYSVFALSHREIPLYFILPRDLLRSPVFCPQEPLGK